MPSETATFTSDITPLILAAHRDNYEIIKILLDRGCTLSLPHDARQVYLHYIKQFILLIFRSHNENANTIIMECTCSNEQKHNSK